MKAPMPSFSMTSGTSVARTVLVERGPHPSSAMSALSMRYVAMVLPTWSVPTSPSFFSGMPSFRAIHPAMTCEFAPVSTSIVTGCPAIVPLTIGSGNGRPRIS
jgi:hypothetical protein